MKILLVGPYPPPHGGISVHVAGIYRQSIAAGVKCAVLDTSRDPRQVRVREATGILCRSGLDVTSSHQRTQSQQLAAGSALRTRGAMEGGAMEEKMRPDAPLRHDARLCVERSRVAKKAGGLCMPFVFAGRLCGSCASGRGDFAGHPDRAHRNCARVSRCRESGCRMPGRRSRSRGSLPGLSGIGRYFRPLCFSGRNTDSISSSKASPGCGGNIRRSVAWLWAAASSPCRPRSAFGMPVLKRLYCCWAMSITIPASH